MKHSLKKGSNRKHLFGILNQSAIYLNRVSQEKVQNFTIGMNKIKRHLFGLTILIHPYHSLNFFVNHHEIFKFWDLKHLRIMLMGGERGTLNHEVVQNLFKFRNLETFDINLREVCEISEDCLFSINWYISRMKKLKSLEYHIGGSAPNLASDFSKKLSMLPSLKEVSADFLT